MKRPLHGSFVVVVACFATLLFAAVEADDDRKSSGPTSKYAVHRFDRLFDNRPLSADGTSTSRTTTTAATSKNTRERAVGRENDEPKTDRDSVAQIDPVNDGGAAAAGADANRTKKSHAPSAATLCFELRQTDNGPYRPCSGYAALAHPSLDAVHSVHPYEQQQSAAYQNAQPPSASVAFSPIEYPAPSTYPTKAGAAYSTAAHQQHHHDAAVAAAVGHDASIHVPSAYGQAAPAAAHSTAQNYPSREPIVLYVKPDYRARAERRDNEGEEMTAAWSVAVDDGGGDDSEPAMSRSAEYGGYASSPNGYANSLTPLLDFHVHKNLLQYGEIPSVSKTLVVTKPLGMLHDVLGLLKAKHKKIEDGHGYGDGGSQYSNAQHYDNYAQTSGHGILISCQPTVVHTGPLHYGDGRRPSTAYYGATGSYQAAIGKSADARGAPYRSSSVYGPIAPYGPPSSQSVAQSSDYSRPPSSSPPLPNRSQAYDNNYRPSPPSAYVEPAPPVTYDASTSDRDPQRQLAPNGHRAQYSAHAVSEPELEVRPHSPYSPYGQHSPAYGYAAAAYAPQRDHHRVTPVQSAYDAAPLRIYSTNQQTSQQNAYDPPPPYVQGGAPSAYPSQQNAAAPPHQQRPYSRPYGRPIVNYGQIVSKPEFSQLSYDAVRPSAIYERPPAGYGDARPPYSGRPNEPAYRDSNSKVAASDPSDSMAKPVGADAVPSNGTSRTVLTGTNSTTVETTTTSKNVHGGRADRIDALKETARQNGDRSSANERADASMTNEMSGAVNGASALQKNGI